MASQAPNPNLPILYNDLVPLSSVDHASWRVTEMADVSFLAKQHAIPVTIDEFALVQRHLPIVFSAGDNPVPLALMGLNEGVNTFIGEDGKVNDSIYIPAYIRRYPFLLARLRPDSDDLSLCFDPTSSVIGAFDTGEELFSADGEQTPTIKRILGFCEEFEQSGAKTGQFMAELKEHDLLMDGEVSIQIDEQTQPFIYRGFSMVDEAKLRELRGDVLRKMNQSGMLPLIYAHLFSLQLMRDIFGRQMVQGRMPGPASA